MRLRWRQAKLAWIAISPKSDDLRGSKLEKPVHKSIKDLCSHLLEIGGESVAVQFNEPPEVCKAILKFGEITPSSKLKTIRGDERECHANSAVLWSKNRKIYFGMTLEDEIAEAFLQVYLIRRNPPFENRNRFYS
jgi:hypothetical protein